MTSIAPAPLLVAHPKPDPAWLARTREEALEPELPIVDPHHHFWDRPGYSYLLDELLADLDAGHTIAATVFVQASSGYRTDGPEALRPVGETEFVTRIAEEAKRRGARTRVCAGIVAYADLTLGARVDEVLEAHLAASNGRVKGVRNIASSDPHVLAVSSTTSMAANRPAGMMAEPAFRAGVARLAQFRLSFDACCYHPQLGEIADLAHAFPDLPIVVNHTGGLLAIGPYRGREREVFADWLRGMRLVAACPNVSMKLGGLGMVLSGFDFHDKALPPSSGELADAYGPYILAAIEAFGVERCMFESNFPVDKSASSYVNVWNAFKRLTSGATADEKKALFHDTAVRFYRL